MIATSPSFIPNESTQVSAPPSPENTGRNQEPHSPSIAILGIPFDNITTARTIRTIEEMVSSGRPHYLATANVDFLVQARNDIELRRILLDAHLVLCDGTPLVWASRLLGNPLPERVAGSDLVPLLLHIAEQKNYRVFFLGATEESAAAAVENLKKKHPNLQVAGRLSPPFKSLLEMDHEEIRQKIRAAKPDLLFVSFGCPKQEKWISMHYRSLGVPVCVGVGATIDFLAGKVRRAPKWMQKTGTEWIFRVAQEPRRLLRRYLTGLWWFGGAIAQQWWKMQLAGGKKKVVERTPETRKKEPWKTVQMPERLDIEAVRRDSLICEQAMATNRNCLFDLSNVRFMDSTGVGLLIRLQKKARITGGRLVLLAPSPAALNTLKLMRLQDFFSIASDIWDARKIFEASPVAGPALLQKNYFPSKPALSWRGEITAANAEEVWQITHTHIDSQTNRKRPLQIDLSALQFIDSAGVNLMLRAKRDATAHGVKLQFVGTQPNVKSVLRMSNLESAVLACD